MKKLISLAMAAVMMLAMFPVISLQVLATDSAAQLKFEKFDSNRDGIIDEAHVVFPGIYSLTGVIDIPATYDGLPVTSIDIGAFFENNGITEINIPDTVNNIGTNAFIGTAIKTISIPDGVTSIGTNAFNRCASLEEITIPASVKSIGQGAFSDCKKLKKVTLETGVEKLEREAFANCTALSEVNIPDSVYSIGLDCFNGTPWYNALPDGQVYVGKMLLTYNGTMPENYTLEIAEGTLGVAANAFGNRKELVDIKFAESLVYIDTSAFTGTSVNELDIPANVTTVGNSAFANCSELEKVTLGDGVKEIQYDAFKSCVKLTELNMPANLEKIGNSAFENCTLLSEFNMPENLNYLGLYTFANSAWLNAQPNGDVYLGNIYYCRKGTAEPNTTITVKDGTRGIAEAAFADQSGLEHINIPNGVVFLGANAFERCINLQEIKLPESVAYIGKTCFAFCTKLNTFTVPKNVTSIEFGTFVRCDALTEINVPRSIVYIGRNALPMNAGITVNFDGTRILWDTIVVDPNYSDLAAMDINLNCLLGDYISGDINGDGVIESSDARTALRGAVKLDRIDEDSLLFKAADMDGDNTISSADARAILRKSVGLNPLGE